MDERALIERLESVFLADAKSALHGDWTIRDDWGQVTNRQAKTEYRNCVFRCMVTPDDANARIQETCAHYAALDLPFRWFVTPSSRPEDLGTRLAAAGFEQVDVLLGMVARADAFGEPPEHVAIEQVTEQTLPDYLAAVQRGWDMPQPGIERARRYAMADMGGGEPHPQQYFLARIDGEPAGAGSHRVIGDFAHLSGASVPPAFRGRGVYRALIQARARVLKERGISLMTIHAREKTSAPICARLGFKEICRFEVFRAPPPAAEGS